MTVTVVNPGTKIKIKAEILGVNIEVNGEITYRVAIEACGGKTYVWMPAESIMEE